MRLTDLALKQLPPPLKGQKIYFDDVLPNFGCRVSKAGTRSFVVQHGDDRQLITIGRYPVVGLSDARSEAKRLLAERVLGKRRVKSVSWDAAVQRFLALCEKKNRPRTYRSYRRLLLKHFRFGRRNLADISRQDVSAKVDKLLHVPAEQGHAIRVVKQLFMWAVRMGHLEHTPVMGMQAIKGKTRERVLTDKELRAVWRVAKEGNGYYPKIVMLLILSGQRRGEISELKWDYFDERNKLCTLPSTLTKNKRTHTFPYGPMTAAVLKRVPNSSDYLFPSSREHVRGVPSLTYNGWTKDKEAFDRQCGVIDWTLHDLRRTFATNMAVLKVPPYITERLLNHSSGVISGVAAIYNRHAYIDEMREAIVRWENHLSELVV